MSPATTAANVRYTHAEQPGLGLQKRSGSETTQRGNYGQAIFHRNEDRRFYLTLLAEFLPHYGVTPEAYCMMSNHVHLVATLHDQKGLSRALQRIHSESAPSLHLRLLHAGHLWQARFHSVALDENISGQQCFVWSVIRYAPA